MPVIIILKWMIEMEFHVRCMFLNVCFLLKFVLLDLVCSSIPSVYPDQNHNLRSKSLLKLRFKQSKYTVLIFIKNGKE
jgi:hypothetical protein